MPQTKKQEIVYTVMMVCVMVYGMVCYNIALDVGRMQNFIFLAAFSELPIMGVIAFLLDTFLVGPAAMRIATGWFTPGKDKQVFLIMAISCLSAWMMCPLMSFFATLLFKDSHNANFVAIWVQTTMLNYPAAFLWQLPARWCARCLAQDCAASRKSETQRHIVKFVLIKLHKKDLPSLVKVL